MRPTTQRPASELPTERLPTGWYATSIGGYRPCQGTYSLYPAESLPPLPSEEFSGGYSWLTDAPKPPHGGMRGGDRSAHVATLRLDLPQSFVDFVSRPDLNGAVPSCTACYWDLSQTPTASPAGDGAHVVRFLNDQQGCLFWYLYLRPDGSHAVICAPTYYDAPDEDEGRASQAEPLGGAVLVADDFESFVYRFWVENLAWYEVEMDRREFSGLSPRVRAYVGHYR